MKTEFAQLQRHIQHNANGTTESIVWVGDSEFALLSGEVLERLQVTQKYTFRGNAAFAPFVLADMKLRIVQPYYAPNNWFCDSHVVMRESFKARFYAWRYRVVKKLSLNFVMPIEFRIAKRFFGLKEGDYFPNWSLSATLHSIIYFD